MASSKAIGVVWGVSSSAHKFYPLSTGAATTMSVEPTGQDYRKSATFVELPAKDGEVKGLYIYRQQKDLNLRVYPNGATLAAAKTANVLPEPGYKFEITDSDDSEIAGTTWVVIECGKGKNWDKHCEFDVTLRRYAADMSGDVAAS